MPHEPDLWYDRFQIFMNLGVGTRTIANTFRIAKQEDPERLTGQTPGHTWSEKAKEFQWIERARAWDEERRREFREKEKEFATDRQLSRLQMIAKLEADAFAALVTANLGDLDQDQARANLPQLRLLLVSLLGLDQAEFGGKAVDGEQASADVVGDEVKAMIEKIWANKAEKGAEIRPQ